MNAERYLSAKELASAMSELGLPVGVDYAREVIRASTASIRWCLRLSDALEFLRTNRDFAPFSNQAKSDRRKRRRKKSDALGIRRL